MRSRRSKNTFSASSAALSDREFGDFSPIDAPAVEVWLAIVTGARDVFLAFSAGDSV
jgi:hypothetical protein